MKLRLQYVLLEIFKVIIFFPALIIIGILTPLYYILKGKNLLDIYMEWNIKDIRKNNEKEWPLTQLIKVYANSLKNNNF